MSETDALVKSLAMGEGDTWTKTEMRLAQHAHDLERRLSLAETMNKGHMRIEDELKAHLRELEGMLHADVFLFDYWQRAKQATENLEQAQARVAELEKDNKLWHANWEAAYAEKQAAEKDAARYRFHAEIFEGKRGIWTASYDSDFMTDEETDAALKDRP
jgi:hypothetical protein